MPKYALLMLAMWNRRKKKIYNRCHLRIRLRGRLNWDRNLLTIYSAALIIQFIFSLILILELYLYLRSIKWIWMCSRIFKMLCDYIITIKYTWFRLLYFSQLLHGNSIWSCLCIYGYFYFFVIAWHSLLKSCLIFLCGISWWKSAGCPGALHGWRSCNRSTRLQSSSTSKTAPAVCLPLPNVYVPSWDPASP